uniref:Tyr recombinase domain-containing protein n=1 Tax=Coleochaete scutata TaxID=3125 RepID=A0A5P9NWK6_COLSC|nr:hypothetical protein [Coleochaete scutata]QFU80114.1 hypothetical protein [Coleochaete scutata]
MRIRIRSKKDLNVKNKKSPSKKIKRFSKVIYRRGLPLRDGASTEIYDYLIKQKKPSDMRDFVWRRNRIVVTLMRVGGLRVSETREIKWKEVKDSFSTYELNVYQPKTKTYRKVLLSEMALKSLNDLSADFKAVFQDRDEWCLGNSAVGRLVRKDNWIKNINRFMRPASKVFKKTLSSHSFRVNYITRLLQFFPINKVRTMVGHKSIGSTAMYDRYVVDTKQFQDVFDKVLST